MEQDKKVFRETPDEQASRLWAEFRAFEQEESAKLPATTGIKRAVKDVAAWGAGIAAAVVTFFLFRIISESDWATGFGFGASLLFLILWLVLNVGVFFLVKKKTQEKIHDSDREKRWNIQDNVEAREHEIQTAIDDYEEIYNAAKTEEHEACILKMEAEADEKMSRSGLVNEIAKCILPFFRQIIDQADRESHMKVRIRLGIRVHSNSIEYYDAAAPTNSIEYYDAAAPTNVKTFSFEEEGISDKLNPVYRKALCKALVTELRGLLFEAYEVDVTGKKIQILPEVPATLVSENTYVPGEESTAPEYDDFSHAKAVILYETFEEKKERHF